MINILKHAHSGVAYLVVLILLVAVLNNVIGMVKRKSFSDSDKKLSLFALIFAHTQILLGLSYLAFRMNTIYVPGFMKADTLRFAGVEHPLMMIVGVTLVTIGWVKHKKQREDRFKFKTLAIYYAIGLIFILSRIPYQIWFS